VCGAGEEYRADPDMRNVDAWSLADMLLCYCLNLWTSLTAFISSGRFAWDHSGGTPFGTGAAAATRRTGSSDARAAQ
jgi:hypothetical protein